MPRKKSPTIRSSSTLRAFLLDQMNGVADGSIEPQAAKSVTNLAQQVYNTINIEVKVASARAKYGDDFVLTNVDFDN